MLDLMFSGLVDGAPVGFALLDRSHRYLYINNTLADLNGVDREAHLGRSVAEVLPHLYGRLRPFYDRALQGETVSNIPIRRLEAGQPERHWLASYYPIRSLTNEVVGVGVVCSETSDMHALLSAMPDFIFDIAADGTHLSFHAPRSEQLYVSPDEIIGRKVQELLPPDVAFLYEQKIAETLTTGAMQMFEYALDYGPNDRRMFDARMVKKRQDAVVVVVRDVTDLKGLEEQFRQAQKMDAIGRLAGGVAHDFNNLLTVINGNVALLKEGITSDAVDLLSEIEQAGQRAAGLTRQLLLFSRQQLPNRRSVNLNTLINDSRKMLERLIGEDVALGTRLDPTLPAIEADPSQLEQVILNLIINARDALRLNGQIIISTQRASSYVVLSVCDNGVGIHESVRSRIFDPFFTTKPPGAGSGLGLSVVFGVVKESGGYIDVETEVDVGTTFHLHFPISRDAGSAAVDQEIGGHMPRGSETVLLVEDEAAVRGLVRRILRSCGYQVLEAIDGLDALERIKNYPEHIDLLLADVVMPRMSGPELAENVLKVLPRIKVLYVSGYTDDEVLRRGILGGREVFLQKPFSPAALAEKVREVLDRA